MAIVFGALPSLLAKLSELLADEYNLQKEVKGGIMFLQTELESMKAALENIGNTPPDKLSGGDKIWSRNVRELSYDIEDNIDAFMVQVKGHQPAKKHGFKFKRFIDKTLGSLMQPKIRRKFAIDIRDTKGRVIKVHDDRRRRQDALKSIKLPASLKTKKPVPYEVVIPIEDDETTKDEAKRKEKKEQQRKGYMKWRLCFSFFGHCFLFALSFISGLGEETSGHDEQTSKKWLRWGMMDVIVPSALLIVMIIIQAFYIDLEDISPDKKTVNKCKRVNLATISCSKIVYFAIREAPAGANLTGCGIAHAIAFLIDMVGAIYLYRNHSCYELDNI